MAEDEVGRKYDLSENEIRERREEIITRMTAILRRRVFSGAYSANLGAESIYDVIIAPLLPVQEVAVLPNARGATYGTLTQFLEDAARYFESRDTKGEDSAHWSNVYNAENCRKAATALEATEAMAEAIEDTVRLYAPHIFMVLRSALAAFRKPGETG